MTEHPISLEEFIMEDRIREEQSGDYEDAFLRLHRWNRRTAVQSEEGTLKRMPSRETSVRRALRHSRKQLSIPDLREEMQWQEGFYRNFRREGLCKQVQVNNLLAPRLSLYAAAGQSSKEWRRMSCG